MCFPILLIAYNRPIHTRKVLESLQKDPLAIQSDLFVYVDGPKQGINEKEQSKIEEVKNVVLSRPWCKSVTLVSSDYNRGCRDAVIFAITQMLEKYEAVIILEDDIIVSPAFLAYMNSALLYYKDRKTVFSISGHSYAGQRFFVPDDYPYDVYASPRLFNWGWGTWADRWELADWSMSYYDEFMNSSYEQQAFARGGDDLIPMLKYEKEGKSSAWDIQFAFIHFANHAVSIVPCKSYTRNIGMDGSGTHCGNSGRQVNEQISLNENANPVFLQRLYFDSRIINLQYNIFTFKKRPFWQRGVNFFARKIGKKTPFVIKKQVFANV